MKTSVPGMAAPEEPSTPPPSPRGTCLAEGVGHACLAQSSLSSLSDPVAPSQAYEPREAIESLWMLPGWGDRAINCKLLVGL